LTHATFSRFREDKELEQGGARLGQVIDAETEKSFNLKGGKPAEPKILKRRVFTKMTKGQTALRKFVQLETDGVDRFPYAVLYTDISLNRKNPIQHALKVANTAEDADALFDETIEVNIKKGWTEYAGD
jgi:hypothetical protein